MQTQTSNTLHNAIMEAGDKDRPPMLAPEDKEVPISKGSSVTTTERYMETYKNVSQDKAIERFKHGESINVQDLKTNLYLEFGKFTSQDGELLESYYSRFYKMMNELIRNQCDVTNHQVNVQFLLQLQPEWQRSQQAATRNRGRVIVNSPTPIYNQEPSMVIEDDEMSKDKEIDKLMALISLSFKKIYKPTNNNLRTSSNTSRANHDNSPRSNRGAGYDNQMLGNVVGAKETVGTTMVQKSEIQCYNCKEFGHVARECQKPKREKDAAYHREKMLLYAAENSGPIFDTKPLEKVSNNDNYNVFAIESEHPEQSESIHDTYLIVQDEHNVIIDSLDMSYDREQIDQHDDDNDLSNERELLASLIVKLKCEIDDSKNRNKFLETSNKLLVNKLKEKRMDESILWDQKCKSSKELFKIKRSVGTICDGMKRCKEAIVKRTYFGHIDPFINNMIEANFCLEIQKINADLEKFHLCLNEEMVADLRYFNSLEHEVDCLKSQLETQKTQFLNEIDRLSREYYYDDHMNAIFGVYKELDENISVAYDSRKTNKRVSFSTRVIPTTSVSRPRLKSNPMEDRVLLNNSHGKKQEVEDYRRNVKFSKNKTSVTACNDSLNAKTLNVNFVCATCGKCVLNEKHDMYVLKSRKSVNSRTKMPVVVPLVEIILFIVNSGCSKHMTGNLKLLIKFVEKFLGMVKFGNDQIAPILGYGDPSTSYIRDLKGNELLTGSRGTDLYSITLQDTTSPNPMSLMAKATSSQAWLWH
nr:hypothetical protein [Tanacetum cinerariifolium]